MWVLWKSWKISKYSRMRRILPAKIWKIYSVKNRRKFPQTRERDIPPDKRHTVTPNRKGQKSHFPVHWPFLRITGLFLPEPQKEVLVSCTWTFSLEDLALPKSRTGNKDTQNSVPHMWHLSITLVYPTCSCLVKVTVGDFLWCPISSLVGSHGWIQEKPGLRRIMG